MISLDKDALICDLAETYHVMEWETIPARKLATLACGLRQNSRIIMKMSGIRIDPTLFLITSIADAANLLVWLNTKAAVEGRDRPKSILKAMLGEAEEEKTGFGFETAEEYENWRKQMMEG